MGRLYIGSIFMKTWSTPIYRQNNLRLMRVHIGFVVFYLILMVAFFVVGNNDDKVSWSYLPSALLLVAPGVILHGILAYGAYSKVELSRKISEIIFAIILLGFPIGTLLAGLFFLPRTTWKIPKPN